MFQWFRRCGDRRVSCTKQRFNEYLLFQQKYRSLLAKTLTLFNDAKGEFNLNEHYSLNGIHINYAHYRI